MVFSHNQDRDRCRKLIFLMILFTDFTFCKAEKYFANRFDLKHLLTEFFSCIFSHRFFYILNLCYFLMRCYVSKFEHSVCFYTFSRIKKKLTLIIASACSKKNIIIYTHDQKFGYASYFSYKILFFGQNLYIFLTNRFK